MTKKPTTISEIAVLAGVSTTTVSYYLNGRFNKMSTETRAKIQSAIASTGYVPSAQARVLNKKRTNVLSVLMLTSTNNWAANFITGMESVAEKNGYQTIVCNTNFNSDTEAMYVEKMLSLGVDGFIIQPTNQFKAIAERIGRVGTPVVFFDCNLFNFNNSWIKTDLYDGVYSAIKTCIDKGYTNFVTILADPHERTRVERHAGFQDALTSHHYEYQTIYVEREKLDTKELSEILINHIKPDEKTLFFVQNQWALANVFEALDPVSHLIPHQVGLLGINSTEWTNLTKPKVSTIVEPTLEEGVLACSCLIDLMEHEDQKHVQKILKCETNWLETTL